MKYEKIKMHGPEHHFLVPAVLFTVVCNKTKDKDRKKTGLLEIRKRAEQVLGGFCGFHGACGAAIGAGIFFSVFSNATPLSKNEWKQSNKITSIALNRIADHGGPRCCKRDSFIAIQEAVGFLEKEVNIQIQTIPIKCTFQRLNKECIKKACPFFVKSQS